MMSAPSGGASGEAKDGIQEPFTLAERLQQLTDIDNDITTLLSLANKALKPLSYPIAGSEAQPAEAPKDFANPAEIHTETQVAAFKEAMDSFLSTLHSVDVQLKRQIWGLEEASIISLKESKSAGVSLEPNGVGDIGGLDVGWLNSRSNKVDRDMEAEQWAKMRAVLKHTGEAKAGAADANMEIDM
ncbi:hypothetical protein CMQ_6157 [Grosmannia clavigera kw1407]|uniref:Mediator of RNA polymerase II transcription subunit 11 n=1 Tax=Grosmannia clavigera (strain kw1407 / UAMH 11150) TaxID=655863 RepID=F0XME9_GROCL|nr:uncharacterized protein CMQ_6157 [Grosmannia clavigera kw1407]EFX01215.1 hypothetical protein CMQ_6157 [Grosmannia clavigera kw1407]